MTQAKIVLVTGGGRSGKSSYAQRLAEALPGPRTFLATAEPFDGELDDRIARHRESRQSGGWAGTLEEPIDIVRGIRAAPAEGAVLVDCLTVWVGNLMWAAEQAGATLALTEERLASLCADIAAAARGRGGPCVFVTNEVGLGIIPDNPASRLYRDLLGRCNQVMAEAADVVVLLVSGLPLVLKGRDPFGEGGVAAGGGPQDGPAPDGSGGGLS